MLLAAWLLAARRDRDEVLRARLDLAGNHVRRAGRRRAWLGLQACADKRAIAALIEKEEYCSTPRSDPRAAAGGTEDEEKGAGGSARPPDRKRRIEYNGKEYVTGQPRPRKPCYPAHEALVHLTGELLPRKRSAWRNWWEKKRNDYEFPALPE